MDVPIVDLIEVGKKAYAEEDFDQAAECLQAVLKTGRRYADLLNIMGIIYHNRGEFNKAIDAFKEALEINPKYVEPRLNLAVLYNDLGNYKEARKLYSKLGKRKIGRSHDPVIDGKLANLHASIGDAYRRLGRFKEAEFEYRRALELGPTYADIRTRIGTALRDDGDTKAALREYRRACKDNPNLLEAHIQLGVTLYGMGRYNEARKEWQQVLKKDPENPKALLYLTMVQDGKAVPKKKPVSRKKKG